MSHLAGLIALAVSEAAQPQVQSSRILLRQSILDEIDRSFRDPELSPWAVAQRVSISVSYLTKLLAEQGSTFSQCLLERRLTQAWQLLDPALGRALTITAVAHLCGFRDSGHFARAFRARFGVTATQRRQAGAPLSPS